MLKVFNKIILFFSCLTAISVPFQSYARNEADSMFWYTLNGDEATVIGQRSALGNTADIPSQVTFNNLRYNVVAIADNAFGDWGLLEYCRIPEGVREIGQRIFSNTKVSSIVVPSTVQTCGGSNYGAFNNSTMRTIIYLPPSPPRFWNAVSNTYVIDPDVYTEPRHKSTNAKIKGIVEFSSHEFEYSGESPTFTLANNLQEDGWNAEYTLPELEKDAGSYEVVIPIKFQHKQTYERFTANVPYRYVIKKQTLTFSLNNQERFYGDDNPPFTYVITGFVGNDDEKSIKVFPDIICSATKTSGIGEYKIIGNGGQSTNYDITFNNAFLTIKKAALSVSVIDDTRVYGASNPQFRLNYIGLKNGELEPQWDKMPIFNTEATKYSNVGRYPISVICEPHNYEITSSETGNLTITKAPLVINATPISREYYEPNPQFLFTLDGLRNNDTIDCLSKQPTFDCLATLSSDCGNYDIIPSSAEALNYDITYRSSVLTITPASLIVRANDVTREYGEDNPILKYELIGLKGNDNIDNAIQGQPSLNTNATTASNVGEYSIIINGGDSKNYTLSYRNGVLTITKAPLSVLAENAERMYGDNNPSFVRSYFGFKLNDSENNAFSVLPKISCPATKMSNVGEYPITITGGTSKNYEVISYENGALTITKATATLTPINKERYYFEDNPSYDFILSGLRNGDSKSCITILPQFICAANKLSDVGTYPIYASEASATNYNFEYGQGSLTINPRQLTASVGNYSRRYGIENPSFEITYTGFVNNEDAAILNQLSVAYCSATISSDVGSYPISVSGGSATNYIITNYNNGLLTIEKADQTITWNQDLSNVELYSQIELQASSDANLPVTYEMSPNNVATLYNSNGRWYLDCFGSGAVNIRAVQNGDKNHNAAPIVSNTLVVMGTGGDPSNPQIFLNIENAGTLPNLIADNRKYQIKNLRLTGYLNGTDINFLREMAGSDSYGNNTPGVLETLDISGCTIVSGGRSYFKSNQTSNNKVGDYMFYNCKQLVNLKLPDNASIIEDYAFADCDRLSVISIPDGVKSFGVQSFRNDISLLRIPMPSGLISIKDYAFMGCNGISEITIPASVTNIGDGIVKDCQNISKINVAEGNNHFASEDGILYISNFDELLIFPVNYETNSYAVKDGTKTIAPYAFVNSKKLNEVTLPSTLTNIGEDAFIGCVNLSSLQVKALNPPVCYNDCFEAVSKTRCELIVPKGCYSYYWIAPVWSDFNKINESDFSGVNDISLNEIEILIKNRHIVLKGVSENVGVSIYQVDGTLLYQAQSDGDNLCYHVARTGTYIVVIGNRTYKLMVQ